MDTIKILKTNAVYRVTDLVFRKGVRWEQDRLAILSDPQYMGTILYDYLLQKDFEGDMEAFKKVVRTHQKKYEAPSEDTLVVHLRLGDILDDYSNDRTYRHFENCKKIYSLLDLQELPKLKKATIVTALHFGANEINDSYFYTERAKERSFELLDLVTNELRKMGLEVSYESNENIDRDICYMVGSKYFLKSLSGLSDIVEFCLDESSLVWSPDGVKGGGNSRTEKWQKKIKNFPGKVVKGIFF